MFKFLIENAILILALAGAVTSYLLVVTQKIKANKRRKTALTYVNLPKIVKIASLDNQ